MDWNDIKRGTLALATLCTTHAGLAKAEQHIVCPMMVDAQQVHIEAPAGGWVGMYGPRGSLQLEGAQAIFTAGSLREAWGELAAPPTFKKKGGAIIDTMYLLPPDTELGKWIICHYGDRIFQALKLPAATKACTVTTRREYTDSATKKPVYRVADITCK